MVQTLPSARAGMAGAGTLVYIMRSMRVPMTWPVVLELALAVLGVIAISAVVAWLLQRALSAWARRRGIPPEDTALPTVRRYLLPVLLVAALHLTLSALDLPRNLRGVTTRLLSATTLALSLYLASQVVLALLGRFVRRSDAGRRAGPQVLTMARVAMLVIAGAILLDNLGVRVTALVTTLGVSSLAVALALQDTLSNFFAGVYLQADRPFRLGDFVRLDSGHEGTVVDIGWRSTRLRTVANTTVVVPNERLLKSIITNFDFPDPQTSLSLRVTVPYGSDVAVVERVLVEAATRTSADLPDVLSEPPPKVQLIPGFVDRGLAFTLTVWVRDVSIQENAQDTIRRHLVTLARAASIDIRASEPLQLIARSL